MCRVSAIIMCCIAAGASSLGAESLSLEQIIENVQSHERLYDDIEVAGVETYRAVPATVKFDKNMKRIEGSDIRSRFVAQKGMFHLESDESRDLADTTPLVQRRVRLFDGHKTQVMEHEKDVTSGVANIIDGRADVSNSGRPHMFLLRIGRYVFPLSTYLRGDKAIKAYPNNRVNPVLTTDVAYQGESDHKGLRCHIVWITNRFRSTGDINDRWVLWLAEERNYIPVRLEGYIFRESQLLPNAEAEITDWRELKPGVWFPSRAHARRYDSFALQTEGKQVLRWRKDYAVESVRLDPNYDVSFFRDLNIPDGTVVYEVADRKITRAYSQGQPTTLFTAGGWTYSILAVAGLAIGFVIVIRYWVNQRRQGPIGEADIT